MGYYVSRQVSWPDGIRYVEIETGGLDMASPGQVGAGEEFDDPREAAEEAIRQREAWSNLIHERVPVAIGTTMGDLAVHSPDHMTEEEIRGWAAEIFEKLPKCDRCGELITERYRLVDDPGLGDFCSEYCAEEVASELARENEQVLIEHPDEYDIFWDAETEAWTEDKDEATVYFRGEIEHDMPVQGDLIPAED